MNEDQAARVVLSLTCLSMALGVASLVPDVERSVGLTPYRAMVGFCVAAVGSATWSLFNRVSISASGATVSAFSAVEKGSTTESSSEEEQEDVSVTATKPVASASPVPETAPASSSAAQSVAAPASSSDSPNPVSTPVKPTLTILYGTTRGTSKLLGGELAQVAGADFQTTLEDLSTYDFDALPQEENLIIVIGTAAGGAAPASCSSFANQLAEATTDFRYGNTHLSRTRFAVFGVGSSMYPPAEFCAYAREMDKAMLALGGRRIVHVGQGDDSGDVQAQFKAWFESALKRLISASAHQRGEDETIPAETTKLEDEASACGADDDEEEEEEEEEPLPEDEEDALNLALVEAQEPVLGDVEDLEIVARAHLGDSKGVSEMVTPLQRTNLTKQGYRLIGSHSAVKVCRWTKAQLRGRGGCYKHTAYGITSYRCMEATPSLACANKCVFCWRTHTNPVGKEWRWKTDPPGFIVEEAVKEHVRQMKTLRGLPGASPQRLAEAMTVRHCALSLVGEPIMYPHINELLRELHDRNISSFLVTNSQFPAAIEALAPITQLYCSVDASTKEALKAVDRPLFPDFYERFLASLDALKRVKGRTVFRLTLVTGRNVGKAEDLEGYARLVATYRPSLIEIKGVTFVGKSDASDLRMTEVPWHREVREFSLKLAERIDAILEENGEDYQAVGYGAACEHAHSVFCLLARKDLFLVENEWHTWIDFEKFHELERRWRATGEGFSPKDYRAKTPSWALFDSKEQGFDPVEERFVKPRHTTTNGIGPGQRAKMEAEAAAAAAQ